MTSSQHERDNGDELLALLGAAPSPDGPHKPSVSRESNLPHSEDEHDESKNSSTGRDEEHYGIGYSRKEIGDDGYKMNLTRMVKALARANAPLVFSRTLFMWQKVCSIQKDNYVPCGSCPTSKRISYY